jgi:hypothetical protein
VAQAAHHKAAAEEKRLLVLYNGWLPDPTPLAILERIWCKSGITSRALACILPLQMASNADSPPAPRHLLHPTYPHILARLHLRGLPHTPALPPVASVFVASVPLAVVHHPLCDLTQVRVSGGPSFCHSACPHLLTFSAQSFRYEPCCRPWHYPQPLHSICPPPSGRHPSSFTLRVRYPRTLPVHPPGPRARPVLVHLRGRTQLDCHPWMSTAANATARQAPAARGRRGSPTPGAAALLPAWSPPLPPLPLLQASPVTDHNPGSHAHAPSARKPATPAHPRRLGLRSGGSTPPRRSSRLHGGGPTPLPRCTTPPPRATRPHRHPPLTGPWLNCPLPPSLPAPAPAPPLALPLLPVQQPVSLPAPSTGLSHHPALLPNPQLAVGSVRTGPGRGDVSSRGGGVMGGVVVVQLSATMGRAGPTVRVFLFFPAVDPPLSPGVTV